jgi:hypothetical protein
MDVHHEVADGAARSELDLGVTAPYAREAIDAVDDDFVSATGYALDGNRVAAESGEEAVLSPGSGIPTPAERKPNERERKAKRGSAVSGTK